MNDSVNPIAISIGKNNPNTGINNVPSPNPENNVKPAPTKVTMLIIKYSMSIFAV